MSITDIKSINANLSKSEYNIIPKLEERIFVNVFLPLFAGDEKLLYEATFQTWFNFAGSPFISVHVIDEQGKVLFTVPPILDRTVINSNNKTRVSMASAVATSHQYSAIHPAQGKAYLDNELKKRATITKVPANMLNYLKTWNEIFTRYKRPTIAEIKETNIASKSKTNYDDFEPL